MAQPTNRVPQGWVDDLLPPTDGAFTMTGYDVHSGLRVRLVYNKDRRTIEALYSGESGVDSVADVTRRVNKLRAELGYLEQWLTLRARRLEGTA